MHSATVKKKICLWSLPFCQRAYGNRNVCLGSKRK